MEFNEPKIQTRNLPFGRLELKFNGERFNGQPTLDTKVTIDGKTLCWITWEYKEIFTEELNEIINKYQI